MQLVWENVDVTKNVCAVFFWVIILVSYTTDMLLGGLVYERGLSSCHNFIIRCSGFDFAAADGSITS
jgi:hypothetical protein